MSIILPPPDIELTGEGSTCDHKIIGGKIKEPSGGYEFSAKQGENPKMKWNRKKFQMVRHPDSTEDEEIVEIVPKD